MAISTYLGNKIIDHILRNQAYSPPATVYASLHTGDPGTTGASEVSGGPGPYARIAISLDAAAGAASSNSGVLTFSGLPAVTVTHSGLWDAASGGNFLVGGTATNRTLVSGDSYEVPVGDADVAF